MSDLKSLLTPKVLAKARGFAHDEILNSAKNPHMSGEDYVAQCWANAVIRALVGSGYCVCLIKDGKELVYQSEQASFVL